MLSEHLLVVASDYMFVHCVSGLLSMFAQYTDLCREVEEMAAEGQSLVCA